MLTKQCGYSSEKGKRAGPWRDANSGLQRETIQTHLAARTPDVSTKHKSGGAESSSMVS